MAGRLWRGGPRSGAAGRAVARRAAQWRGGNANRPDLKRERFMGMVVCPHCKSHRIVTSKIPKDVVVVMPCPNCHELSVLFRNKIVPLDRHIIESGTFKERKEHLAGVIAEFLETILSAAEGEPGKAASRGAAGEEKSAISDQDDMISQEEMERFVRIDLKHIDNSAYFRRHFS